MRGDFFVVLLSCTFAAGGAPLSSPKARPDPTDARVELSANVKPRLLLRKRLQPALPLEVKDLTLICGVDMLEPKKLPALGASCTEPWLRGRIGLKASQGTDPVAEWTRTWIVPGLLDAATRFTTRVNLNLRTGRPDADLRLGLRRTPRGPGVALVHQMKLEGTPCSVDLGATITVPEELRLAARGGLSHRGGVRGKKMLLGIDVDTFDVCVDG